MKLLEGKTVLVTGGSGGIGNSICREAAKAGANVALTYRSDQEGGERMVAEIEEMGLKAKCYHFSAGESESADALFENAFTDFGTIDSVVNNAGMDGKRGNLWELEPKDWEAVISVNLIGAYQVAARALPHLVKNGAGTFLAISSVHERVPWGGHTAYTATKAGLGMMIKSLALELADTGVRAVSLAPGAIKTEINKDVWDNPETLADLKDKIPMNRMGTTKEIAKTAVFLMSEYASYVTGTTLYADGGMSTYPSFAKGG